MRDIFGSLARKLLAERDAAGRAGHVDDTRRGPDDADGVGGGASGCLDECGEEKLSEQVRTETVAGYMLLVVLDAATAEGHVGDTGIVEQNIETILLLKELGNARADGGKIVEIEVEALELARVIYWQRPDFLDGGGDSVRGAARDVDGATLGVQHLDYLEPYARVAAGHNEDLARQRWESLIGPRGARRQELSPDGAHDCDDDKRAGAGAREGIVDVVECAHCE